MTPNNTTEEEHWKDTLDKLLQAVSNDEIGSFKDVEDWHYQELQKARRCFKGSPQPPRTMTTLRTFIGILLLGIGLFIAVMGTRIGGKKVKQWYHNALEQN